MSIYAIADLHLSYNNPKPMNIFGDNWEEHEKKIEESWINLIKENDTVLIPGDFSWATYLKDTEKDFEYLNRLPGKKIISKGNHDYYWTTVTKMQEFLKEKNFNSINFLFNNSYCIENHVIVGTRGWSLKDEEQDIKMINREIGRLELSIKDGIKKYGENIEIISCLHYPPITKSTIANKEKYKFIDVLKKYNIKECLYGHLHGKSQEDSIEGEFEGINLKLISADYLNFKPYKVV